MAKILNILKGISYKINYIPYSMLSSPSPKRPTLAKIREGGLDNGGFLFLKIFENFLKFYNYYTKSATGGLFYY